MELHAAVIGLKMSLLLSRSWSYHSRASSIIGTLAVIETILGSILLKNFNGIRNRKSKALFSVTLIFASESWK